MARALPHLAALISSGPVQVDAISLLSPQLRWLQVARLDDAALEALARHPLPGLQHCSTIQATAPCITAFISAHLRLSSIALHDWSYDHSVAAIVRVLASLPDLTELRIERAQCTSELMNALCDLPRLQRLTLATSRLAIGRPVIPTLEFWSRIPTLSALMESRLTDKQHAIELRITVCRDMAVQSDAWWLAALRASLYCSEMGLNFAQPDQAVWQRFLSQTQGMPASKLRAIAPYNITDGGRTSADTMGRLIDYGKMHTGVTRLDLDRRGYDSQLYGMLSHLPCLTDLTLSHGSALTIHRALTNSSALTKLLRVSCLRIDDLAVLLALIRGATQLKLAHVGTSAGAWPAIPLSEVKASTHHLTDLRLSIATFEFDVVDSELHAQSIAAAKLLLLPNLTKLHFGSIQ